MAQARTLDESQIKRVQRYLRTRRNSTPDSTIFTFAFNTGLRAKELAALCVGDAEVDTSMLTPCANCFSLYLQTVDYVVQPHTHHVTPSSPSLPTKGSVCVCLQS